MIRQVLLWRAPGNPDSPADGSVLTAERRRPAAQTSSHSRGSDILTLVSAPGDGRAPHGSQPSLHFLAKSAWQARPCSRAAGGRRGLEGKERQAKPGELRAAGTTQPRGQGAWARTGQGRPLWGWQVTPQVEKGPRGGCRGVGTADGDEGQQVAELRQPHPGPDTGPGARAGDQGQGPRGSEATQASVRPADPAGVKRGSRQR